MILCPCYCGESLVVQVIQCGFNAVAAAAIVYSLWRNMK